MRIYIEDNIEQLNEQDVRKLVEGLPEWRREKAERFKHLAGKRECALVYHLLQRGLREEYGITTPPHFDIGEHGKPSLREHPDVHFNASHCKMAVICVIHDRPIGVDIERCRPLKDSLVAYTMNEEERKQIEESQDPELEFARLWTAKEAVVKLTGKGLQGQIRDILREENIQNIRISTFSFPEKHYAYSIAENK